MELSFSDVTCKSDLLKGTKKGTIYLTPYRVCHCCRRHKCKATGVYVHVVVTVDSLVPHAFGVAGVCEQQHQGLPGFSYVSLLFDERLQH